jgi:hypothetical protein
MRRPAAPLPKGLAQRQTDLETEPSVDANGPDRWEDALNNG